MHRATIRQQFSTGVMQEILKHAIPDCLDSSIDVFSRRLSNKRKNNNPFSVNALSLTLNQKHVGHIIEWHLNGHIAYNKVASNWLIIGTRNPYIRHLIFLILTQGYVLLFY